MPNQAQRNNPLAAPLGSAALDGLPPAVVVTAGYDSLRDEGERYADRLEESGVIVLRHCYRSTIHGFLWMAGALTDDFRQLINDLGADVSALLSARG